MASYTSVPVASDSSRGGQRCPRAPEGALGVFLFSSGPVDSSAEQGEIPPVPAVARQTERLRAREHVTFGGSITESTPGLMAKALARHGKGGDFRDPEGIQTWAHHISSELATAA
ncbi:menaquinone-dependent protoporphyrinogen oxidase [Streptomyces sp. CG 926]|nr:menaquinone-dependent protoporphyrinogen oxidase [Streptomyces sp. CG 926]